MTNANVYNILSKQQCGVGSRPGGYRSKASGTYIIDV